MPLVLLVALSYLVRTQDTQTIIAQTILAHGGDPLGLISNVESRRPPGRRYSQQE
jgi:hypothetical protein